MSRKVLLLEVNEVPFALWDRSSSGNAGIADLLLNAAQFTTVTDDLGYETRQAGPDSPQLAPWVTWPTVHRGVTNAEHQILDIGQDLTDADAKYPPIWKIVADAGKSAGVFGSMHSYPVPESHEGYEFYVPDPFALTAETLPAEAEHFQAFNLAATRSSGRNVSKGLQLREAVEFVAFAPKLGVKPKTAAQLVRQLVGEVRQPESVTKRRAFQTSISFDIFEKQLVATKPDMATFFCNHVAASMHRYWAATFPGDYDEIDVDDGWIESYAGEIPFAMQVVNDVIERSIRFCQANPEYVLVVASSMGQHPTKAQQVRTELELKDPGLFVDRIGLPSGCWSLNNSMFPNFNISIEGADNQQRFGQALDSMLIDGKLIDYRSAEMGFFSLDLGQPNLDDPQVEVNGVSKPASWFGFENLVVQDTSMKCADHVREGSLFILDPVNQADAGGRPRCSSTVVAPTILDLLGISPPAYMQAEPLGHGRAASIS